MNSEAPKQLMDMVLTQHHPKQHIDDINGMCLAVHEVNRRAGWWTDPKTGEYGVDWRNFGELLMLITSEIVECMEGHRKDMMDGHLPNRKSIEVELADAVVRILDLAGAYQMDLGGAIAEKMAFNATRADHKLENRMKPGGKAY